MTDQTEDRIALEDMNLVLAVEYHDALPDGATHNGRISVAPSLEPFVLFQMKQEGGAIVADITASLIADEQELIETLEVFLTALVEERAARVAAAEASTEPERDVEIHGVFEDEEEVCGYSYDHDTSGSNPNECRKCGAELEQFEVES